MQAPFVLLRMWFNRCPWPPDVTAVPSRWASPSSRVSRKVPACLRGFQNNSDLCEALGIYRMVEMDTNNSVRLDKECGKKYGTVSKLHSRQ